MKILRISATLSADGFKIVETYYDVRESRKVYIFGKEDLSVRVTGTKQITKASLLKMEDRFIPKTSFISNTLWCLPEQTGQGRVLLQDFVIETAKKFKFEIDALMKNVNKIKTTKK